MRHPASERKQHQIIAAACEPPLDERTVAKFMRGDSVSPMSAAVIRAGLRKLGIAEPRSEGGAP